jgi:hypothetical protein
LLIALTIAGISGSSIGVYKTYFYGTAKDSHLLANSPELVRSDEWRVGTQLTLAQKNDNYAPVNKNLGNGENMTILLDLPYKEWSEAFKPHNLAFFVLPFEQALAFKWWFMGYLLILSCYFFILTMLPGKKLLATILACAVFFSAFVQWWYQYAALGSLYYSLFLLITFIYILRSHSRLKTMLLSGLFAYLLVSFVLILYPPFQVACGLAVAAFGMGFLIQSFNVLPRKDLLKKIGLLILSIILAGAIVFLFVKTRSGVVHTIENTAYPGKRIVSSGGFNLPHIFAGNLGFQFRSITRTTEYLPIWFNNQSETSNFILLLPFLLLPSAIILYRDYRQRKPADWPLLLVSLLFFVFLAWLCVPHLQLLGKVLQLNKVPLTRLLIGIGLLNLLQLVLFIRRSPDITGKLFQKKPVLVYAALIFIFELLIGLHAERAFPGFISFDRVVLFAIPIPVIVYLLLRKHFEWAAAGLLAFSLFTSVWINPLYQGTSVITQTPLSKAIQSISSHDNGKWVVEDTRFENFALLNGAHSLSGVYAYPQLNIWQQTGADEKIYNRFAHTSFGFDRDTTTNIPTRLELEAPDYFQVITEPCGSFLQKEGVHFIIAGNPLNSQDSCLKLIDTVKYPDVTAYIYRISH